MELLKDLWKSDYITGERRVPEPKLCLFQNSLRAFGILDKHLANQNSRILLHIDVDVDGLLTGYQLYKVITERYGIKPLLTMNNDKIHGIREKHVKYCDESKVDLIIISDSSSNSIELIKQFNCDVIVIDHHELTQAETFGKTHSGKDFVIVNNTVENTEFEKDLMGLGIDAKEFVPWHGDERMSCGVEVYELLRVHSKLHGYGRLLDNLKLIQCAGITLFSDAIDLIPDRNQWYIEQMFEARELNSMIYAVMKSLETDCWKINKTFINYTFSPLINRAIRVGQRLHALKVIFFEPNKASELLIYKEVQEREVSKALGCSYVSDSFSYCMLSSCDVHVNYSGVVASKLVESSGKNAVAFKVMKAGESENGLGTVFGDETMIAKGSFRGKHSGVDYRLEMEKSTNGVYAQGHKQAFGFEVPVNLLPSIMNRLHEIEPEVESGEYFSYGEMPQEERGFHHISDFDKFKRDGYLFKIGVGNSRVRSDLEIRIKLPVSQAEFIEQRGKLYLYDVMGLTCLAFQPLHGGYTHMYVEYSNQLNFYLK